MPAVLNIEAIDVRDRTELWREACARTAVGVEVRESSDEPLGGSVRAFALSDLVVGQIEATAQRMTRTARLIREAEADYLLLGLQAGGTGRVGQGDHRALLQPGDCVVFESHRPFELDQVSAFDLWVFAFPRSLVRIGDRDLAELSALRIPARDGLAGVARRALLDLATIGDAARDSGESWDGSRVLAGDLLLALLAAPLSQSRHLRRSLSRTLPMRIKDYVNQRLADPTLDPRQVAEAFGITTRYLHKVFESEAETVGQYIRGRRLERCRLRLLDPRFDDVAISTLAFGAGFGDLSGFNRAFKNAYGQTPRELRNTRGTTGRSPDDLVSARRRSIDRR